MTRKRRPSARGEPRWRDGARDEERSQTSVGRPGEAAASALLLSGTALVFAATTRTARPLHGRRARAVGRLLRRHSRRRPHECRWWWTLFVTGSTGGASNGSGEFLDPEGHVLTNNHVISSAVGGGRIVVLRPVARS